MAVCFKNLTLGALSSRSALSVLVGALFKKFGLFKTPRIYDSVNVQPAFVKKNKEPSETYFNCFIELSVIIFWKTKI